MDPRRRQLFRGRISSTEVRPPWLLSPTSFTQDCTRCGHCLAACPEGIISAGDGGFPRLDFGLGECTFCGECTLDCEAHLFHQDPASEPLPWRHKATVSDACLTHFGVMCRSCEDACEPRALRFPLTAGAVPTPVIDSQICNGCGACVRPCPEQAISMFAGS